MKKHNSIKSKTKFKIPAATVLATSFLLSNFAGAVPAFAAETPSAVADVHNEHTELSHITGLVAKVEQTKNIDDLIHARQDVNGMEEGGTKAGFQNRLRAVEKQLLKGNPLDDAKFYVAEVELCLCPDLFKLAQAYVSELNAGADKESFQVRLEVVQYKIENKAKLGLILAANGAVGQAENKSNQANVDYAKYVVNQLENGPDKTNLTNRLELVQNRLNAGISFAQSALIKAESTKSKGDFTEADTLVNALPYSSAKESLLERLSALKYQIDNGILGNSQGTNSPEAITQATQAVSYAESVRTTAAYNTASSIVNVLAPGTTKTVLLNRLEAINLIGDIGLPQSAYKLAEEAVKAAEYVRTQVNYDRANALISELPDGSDKTILLKRLSVVKVYLDKLTDVETGEQSKEQTPGQTPGQTGQPNSPQQNDDGLKNATDKVGVAESSRTEVTYNTAKSSVGALPSSSSKIILLHRLAVVKAYLDEQSDAHKYGDAIKGATDKVERAESSRTKDTYDLAKYFVDALPSSSEKSTLLNRLNVVDDYLAEKEKVDKDAGIISSATVSVSKAELNRTQANYDTAKKLVDALPESDSKITLLNRLTTINKYFDSKNSTTSLTSPTGSITSPTGTATTNPTANPNAVNKVTNGVQKSQAQEIVEKQIATNLQKHWIKKDMQNLMDRNIFIWDNAQTFKPDDKVTQAEFVALIARAYETNMAAVNPGVLKGKFASEIRVGLDKGFIKNTSELNKSLTREDAVRMLVRALRQKANIVTPSTNLVKNYKDGNKIGVMARSDFNYALHTKLIYGTTQRNLNAQGTVTKAEAIAFVSRLVDKIPAVK